MKFSIRMRTRETLVVLVLALLVCAGGVAIKQASAQEPSAPAAPAQGRRGAKPESKEPPKELPPDDYQRSAQVLYMTRMGKAGADRGQEIYYMKCWMCHNDYTRKVDPQAAPTLKGLYQRAKLMTGQPVTEDSVLNQIKEGSARMPAYKWGLSDKDLSDLMTYLKEKCCWDEDNPPANPRYKGK